MYDELIDNDDVCGNQIQNLSNKNQNETTYFWNSYIIIISQNRKQSTSLTQRNNKLVKKALVKSIKKYKYWSTV